MSATYTVTYLRELALQMLAELDTRGHAYLAAALRVPGTETCERYAGMLSNLAHETLIVIGLERACDGACGLPPDCWIHTKRIATETALLQRAHEARMASLPGYREPYKTPPVVPGGVERRRMAGDAGEGAAA